MSNTVKHKFASTKTNTSDASKVQPSNWNDEHAFAGGALGSLLYRDTGASDGANWLADVATGSVLVSGGVGAAPAFSATPTLTDLTLTGVLKAPDGSAAAPTLRFTSVATGFYRTSGDSVVVATGGAARVRMSATGSVIMSGGIFWGGSGADLGTVDTSIVLDAANILAQRNGTNAQKANFYKTFTDASNYERLEINAGPTGFMWIRTEKAGTGGANDLYLGSSGGNLNFQSGTGPATRWSIGTSGNLTGVTATGGLGYGTGAGGTVTQLTNKATGVTLSKVCGQITMDAAALAGDTTVSFVLTNTAIAATDVLLINHVSGGTAGSYSVDAQCAAGTATIVVRNVTTGSLSEAIVLRFALVKGATA